MHPQQTHWGSCNKQDRHAITTVMQSRVPIFLPVSQVSPAKKQEKNSSTTTSWGEVVTKGVKLTQVHRNLLDCVMAYHFRVHKYPDGCVGFLISLRQLQKNMGINPTNHQWLVEKLDQLMETIVVVKTSNITLHTHIVRKHCYSQQVPMAGHGPKGGQNMYYGIVFEAEWMRIFEEDIKIYSADLVTKIIALHDPLLQAFVRFCLTHRQLNMSLCDVLTAIGGSSGVRQVRRYCQKLANSAADLQDKFGISIKDNIVFYRQHKDVWIDIPQSA